MSHVGPFFLQNVCCTYSNVTQKSKFPNIQILQKIEIFKNLNFQKFEIFKNPNFQKFKIFKNRYFQTKIDYLTHFFQKLLCHL